MSFKAKSNSSQTSESFDVNPLISTLAKELITISKSAKQGSEEAYENVFKIARGIEAGLRYGEKQQAKDRLFAELGCENGVGYEGSILTVASSIVTLKKAGFNDPVSLIKKFLSFVGYDIRRVIADMKGEGFEDPVKTLEKFPPLAGLDTHRVIADLKADGFKDPVKAIEKFPPLAGLAEESKMRKIRYYNIYGTKMEQIETRPVLLSYNLFLRIVPRLKYANGIAGGDIKNVGLKAENIMHPNDEKFIESLKRRGLSADIVSYKELLRGYRLADSLSK